MLDANADADCGGFSCALMQIVGYFLVEERVQRSTAGADGLDISGQVRPARLLLAGRVTLGAGCHAASWRLLPLSSAGCAQLRIAG